MTINQLENLEKGTTVFVSRGRGWQEVMTYHKLVNVTSFGKMTYTQFLATPLSKIKTRKMRQAKVVDANGKTYYVHPKSVIEVARRLPEHSEM